MKIRYRETVCNRLKPSFKLISGRPSLTILRDTEYITMEFNNFIYTLLAISLYRYIVHIITIKQ